MKAVFIGLGRMGSAMAERILGSGLPLELWNRDPSKSGPFRRRGVKVHDGLEDALSGASLAFTMLSDDDALRAVVNRRTLPLMEPGGAHVSLSTVGIEAVREAAALARDHGLLHLSAPVFGRPEAAASGTLGICLSGDPAASRRAEGYLRALGSLKPFGSVPEAAVAVKLCGNFMIASLLETLSEAFSLAEGLGVPPESFFALMSGTLFNAPAVRTYGSLILAGEFDRPGFTTALGAKDVGLVREAARLSGIPMSLVPVLEERFAEAVARGWGDRDWCSISELQKPDGGA
ncbi:MAG: NAD(P)-dependent oxidoreductase [Deltaproteobacteria bacterium]|jgi:3-hydroxyisobutyrate dehydrogenase-like beta-hydroxyacid dehydrogenase|nr:NAD(P)-dependent oxidoreductase [Deltaproteobacteria bacterium]